MTIYSISKLHNPSSVSDTQSRAQIRLNGGQSQDRAHSGRPPESPSCVSFPRSHSLPSPRLLHLTSFTSFSRPLLSHFPICSSEKPASRSLDAPCCFHFWRSRNASSDSSQLSPLDSGSTSVEGSYPSEKRVSIPDEAPFAPLPRYRASDLGGKLGPMMSSNGSESSRSSRRGLLSASSEDFLFLSRSPVSVFFDVGSRRRGRLSPSSPLGDCERRPFGRPASFGDRDRRLSVRLCRGRRSSESEAGLRRRWLRPRSSFGSPSSSLSVLSCGFAGAASRCLCLRRLGRSGLRRLVGSAPRSSCLDLFVVGASSASERLRFRPCRIAEMSPSWRFLMSLGSGRSFLRFLASSRARSSSRA